MRFNSPLNWAFRDWSQKKKWGSKVQRFLEFMTRSDTARARSVRKHLSPFTQMIRVEDRIEESEEEADPDLSFHQARSLSLIS